MAATSCTSRSGTKSGGATDPRGVFVGSLDANEPAKLLLDRGSNAKYAQGRLFFLRGSTLVSQPFEVDRLALTGTPTTIAENIQLSGNSTTGAAGAFSVSQTGVLGVSGWLASDSFAVDVVRS
jgi:hypothetical protein